MDRSLYPPLLQNPACAFPRTRLLSEVPVATGTRPVKKIPVELVIRGLAPSRCWASLPHATAWVLAHVQRYYPRSPPPHRPHVSVSEALPSALASCGILADTPCGWYLLTPMCERMCRITPFPVSMVASVGRCSPPGFVAVQTGQYRRLPAPYPMPFWLQRVSLLRWFAFTMAQPHLCLRCPEMLARRDTQIEAARVRRVSPLQTVEDQSQVWGIGCHSCTWREGLTPS